MPTQVNGHSDHTMANGSDVVPQSAPGKKGKQRKVVDNNDTTRLLQARISQLEQDAAGEKDQEAEIGMRFLAMFPSHSPARPPTRQAFRRGGLVRLSNICGVRPEREVKRANRDLMQQMAKIQDPGDKIDFLLRKSSELLADMRRMERENQKNKKRGDTLQKEKDANRTELSKTVTLKEKLEKLCRELQRDNNKLKV